MEMAFFMLVVPNRKAPSPRRVWIDINFIERIVNARNSHPPHGGCGLKSMHKQNLCLIVVMSPSTRRVWIEI